MKRYVVLLLLVIACVSSCKHKQANYAVPDIQKTCKEINGKLKDYTTKHTDDLSTSTPGTITGYYRDEEVKKVYEEHFGEKNRTFREYYFDDGMLIYVQSQNYIYNKPNTYTEEVAKKNNDTAWYDDKKTRLEVSRYYFSNNKMLKWEAGDKDIPAANPDFINKQFEILSEAVVLLKELKEQDQ